MHITHQGTVIFLHIPKAAGNTLKSIIKKQYKPQSIFVINGSYVEESIERFKKLPEPQKKAIQVLVGHMPFGLHEYLLGPSTYITMLRHPVDRIVSHFYYVLRVPNHYLHKEVIRYRMNLKDYVSSGISTEIDNGQTRLLSGMGRSSAFGHCSSEMLECAKYNLRNYFSVIGLLERFDETLMILKRSLNWNNLFYIKENRSKYNTKKEHIPKETLKFIEKYNEFDMDLYKYIKREFEEKINQLVPDIDKELKRFRKLNKMYSLSYPIFQKSMILGRRIVQKGQR